MAVIQGQFNGRSQYYLTLAADQTSQSVEGNYSNVWVDLRINESPNWGSWSNGSLTWSFVVEGQSVSGATTYDFRNYDVLVLWNGNVVIPHNADGTKTIYFRATAGGGTVIGSADTGIGGLTLNTIPRASTPSVVGGATFEAGSTVTINTNRASSSFTHTVQYAFGTIGWTTIATNVANSTTWTPPLSLLNQIPSSPTGNGTIRLITYSGGTQVGVRDITFFLTTPASVIPTWTSVTVSENNSTVASAVGAYVQGVSRLNFAINGAAGVYGSTIALRRFTAAGQTVDGAAGTTPLPIASSGTVPVTWMVQDTRGRQKTQTQNITVLPYSSPKINSSSVQRALSNGTADPDDGTYIRVNLNAAVSSLINGTQRNIMQIKIRSRIFGSNTPWTDASTLRTTLTPAGITYNSFATVNGPFLVDQSYEIRVEVVDRFNTSAFQTTIPVGAIFMHWGDGLGVGKYHENGMLDVNGDIYQNGAKVSDYSDLWKRRALLPGDYRGYGPTNVKIISTGGTLTNIPWVGEYDPLGSRVVVLSKDGAGSHVILRQSSEESYGRWIRLELQNDWQDYGETQIESGWSEASAVRLPSGIVSLSGLIRGGTVASNTIIATLPVGYRPDRNMIFLVANNDAMRSISVNTDGTIRTRGGWTAGFFTSLERISFPAAGVATWTNIGSAGSAFANDWTAFNAATYGAPAYWKDPYGFVWFCGLVGGGSTASDNTNIFTLPASHRADLEQHMATTSNEAYGLVGARSTDGINWKTGTSSSWISLAGVTIRTVDALNNNTWYYPGGGSRNLALTSGWTYTGAFPLPSYTVREDGLCVSAGLLRSGTMGNHAFRVIREAVPKRGKLFMSVANNNFSRIDLNGRASSAGEAAEGRLTPMTGSNAWVSLDGLKWVSGGI